MVPVLSGRKHVAESEDYGSMVVVVAKCSRLVTCDDTTCGYGSTVVNPHSGDAHDR